MVYIDALTSQQWPRVEAAAKAHLKTARETLLSSIRE